MRSYEIWFVFLVAHIISLFIIAFWALNYTRELGLMYIVISLLVLVFFEYFEKIYAKALLTNQKSNAFECLNNAKLLITHFDWLLIYRTSISILWILISVVFFCVLVKINLHITIAAIGSILFYFFFRRLSLRHSKIATLYHNFFPQNKYWMIWESFGAVMDNYRSLLFVGIFGMLSMLVASIFFLNSNKIFIYFLGIHKNITTLAYISGIMFTYFVYFLCVYFFFKLRTK